MKILFVCTGNTCRSPMAQGIASKLYNEIDFDSAGLSVNPFDSVSKNAVKAAGLFSADISDYIPKQIDKGLIDSCDIIVPMTNAHKEFLLQAGVDKNKIRMFNEDISDPYGGGFDIYFECAKQLKNCVVALIGEINDNKA